MDARAIEHAKARLRKADKAVETLKAADNFESAEDAWSDFLLAASAVYSKLEQGAKGTKSEPWFGRKKHERRIDPLLNYLHIARNSDEHGIDRVADRGGNTHDISSGIPQKLKFNERREFFLQAQNPETGKYDTEPAPAYLYGPSLQLVTVHDRRTAVFREPPTEHLGQQIKLDDLWLTGVADLGLTHLKKIIGEAEDEADKAGDKPGMMPSTPKRK